MTPAGAFAVPAKVIFARPRCLWPLRCLASSATVARGFGLVMTTAGAVPLSSVTGVVTGSLTAPWRSTTTSCATTVPGLA